ncbi:MAG: glutamate--cysteine ligase [Prolixibacteraceae bacterium]|nr:glutamate--cysteine ligase [Prolixibacteraceae bacterium]
MYEIDKIREIKHKSQLIEYFEQGCKHKDRWGIGTEHEKFIFQRSDFKRVSYDSESGIRTILISMQNNNWEPLLEGGNITGLKKNGASVTLEPGGQFELSGNNFRSLKETFLETKRHFKEVEIICRKLNLFTLPLGVDPLTNLEDVPWMPKERYRLMKRYMPEKGELGLEMMANTASVQVNLDFESETDMIKKMRIAQALQPVVTAIFANSPFSHGKSSGYLSYRAHIWDDTDPDRCGFLPFIFDEGFGFERWVDYLLDIPMYFIYRDGNYLSSKSLTFRGFMKGLHDLRPIMGDWETHISTVFPDVRLRQFIEMRGADAGCVSHIAAVPALWVGLLYDSDSLEETYDLISGWDTQTISELRSQVPVKGLSAAIGELHAGKIAKYILRIALEGLNRRSGTLGIENESCFLAPVQEIVESGITQAERLLQLYERDLNNNLRDIVYIWQKLQSLNCPDEPATF